VIAAAEAPSFAIREACPDDAAFVAATFAEQLLRGRHSDAHGTVNRVLDSRRVRILVAEGADGRLTGWLCYVPLVGARALVFAYVRNKHRLQGVGGALADRAWPDGVGRWVHPGLRGGSTSGLLRRFPATEVPLEELL
jgi:hypothetical protein